MTEPPGNEPMGPADDLVALAGLDLALDELAAGRDVPAERAGREAVALATLAAELREAVPAPPSGAAQRGRAAFLAAAAAGGARGVTPRRSLPLRLAAVATALVALAALPAAAGQARPGTALWPVRQAGQQVRDRLAGDPVHRARLRLNTAESFLAVGTGAAEERREDMADQAEERIKAAMEALEGVPGPEAAAERARAARLLLQVEALERQKDADDRFWPGSGSGAGDDGSGGGGGDDDPSGDDRSGRGGKSGASGSESGSSGSGSGSGRSGSGHD
jgi:hypothetical protein